MCYLKPHCRSSTAPIRWSWSSPRFTVRAGLAWIALKSMHLTERERRRLKSRVAKDSESRKYPVIDREGHEMGDRDGTPIEMMEVPAQHGLDSAYSMAHAAPESMCCCKLFRSLRPLVALAHLARDQYGLQSPSARIGPMRVNTASPSSRRTGGRRI